MGEFWFKPRTHGYGAAPLNWKGWALTLGYAAFVLSLAYALVVHPALQQGGPGITQLLVFFALFAIATWLLLRVTRAKTDGEWKWRWGDKGN